MWCWSSVTASADLYQSNSTETASRILKSLILGNLQVFVWSSSFPLPHCNFFPFPGCPQSHSPFPISSLLSTHQPSYQICLSLAFIFPPSPPLPDNPSPGKHRLSYMIWGTCMNLKCVLQFPLYPLYIIFFLVILTS